MLARRAWHEPDVAIATLEESVRVARDAGILSALSIGLPFLAGMLPIEESERALALLDEAIEVGTRLGDRYFVSVAIGSRGVLALRRGDWRTALHTAVERVERQLQLGDLGSLNQSFLGAGLALAEIGKLEPAAVLFGKADTLSPRMVSAAWGHKLLQATDTALLETLGEQHLATLTAQGAALDNDEAVAYMPRSSRPSPRHAITRAPIVRQTGTTGRPERHVVRTAAYRPSSRQLVPIARSALATPPRTPHRSTRPHVSRERRRPHAEVMR